MVGGSVSSILQAAFLGWMISEKNGRKLGILVHQPNKDLGMLAELVVAGKLKPIINHIYPLSKVPEAMKLIGEGKAIGKVIITI
jgi:NADPH:quinone reductase-like Zn-dependent oxidoreductase